MKNLFNFSKKDTHKEEFCPICGKNVVDGFCNECNRYVSNEVAHEALKKKYPGTKCIKCKSKKIHFSTAELKEAQPKNGIEEKLLKAVRKHNEKYPQEIPAYREIAKCEKCGHTWFVDGYKDDAEKVEELKSKLPMVGSAVFLAILLIVILPLGVRIEHKKEQNIEASPSTTVVMETITEKIITTEKVTETQSETTDKIAITQKVTIAETEPKKSSIIVYITPYGKKYHCSADCAGENAMERDLDDVKDIYDPCSKCAY